ncbi:TPA: hypothetical protein ACIRVE_000148 [Pseudomonas putida]
MPSIDAFLPCQRYDASHAYNLFQVVWRYLPMAAKAKPATESELDALEQLIPDCATEATHCAYLRALQVSRNGVLRTDDGHLVRVAADGSKTVVAEAKPRRKVTIGEKVSVRKVSENPAQ